MKILTATLGLVALVALALGLSATFAQSGENISARLIPNSVDEAGCLIGEVALPVSDFGKFVKNGDKWDASNHVVLTIPLSQNLVPQAIDCRIEISASDLAVAESRNVIPRKHLTVTGCDVVSAVSLAVPQGMTCVVDKDTRQVQITVSLVGLDRPASRVLSGTIVISGVNGA
jgi:hypothetical protein